MANINKEINQNLKNLLNTGERRTSNIDTLQSREYLEKREVEREVQKQIENQNIVGQVQIKNNEKHKSSNASSVFSVRIKNKDVVALKLALKKQGINNFSTGLKTIIYKYIQDNGIG